MWQQQIESLSSGVSEARSARSLGYRPAHFQEKIDPGTVARPSSVSRHFCFATKTLWYVAITKQGRQLDEWELRTLELGFQVSLRLVAQKLTFLKGYKVCSIS